MTRDNPGLLAAALLAIASCHAPPPPPLVVTWAGCAEVRVGPVCHLEADADLVLVVDGLDPRPEVTCDVGPVRSATVTELLDAVRLRVRPAPSARQVTLRRGRARFTLRLRPAEVEPALEAARAHRRRGDLVAARGALAAAHANMTPVAQARADGLEARLQLSEGAFEPAGAGLEAAAEAARAQGLLSAAADDLLAAAWVHTVKTRRFDRARAALAQVAQIVGQVPSRRAALWRSEAQLDLEVFDLRGARAGNERAWRWADRHDDARQRYAASMMLGSIDVELGHVEAAVDRFSALRSAAPTACQRANAASNLGWAHLSNDDLPAARAALGEAIGLCTEACPDATCVAYGHLNLAIAAVDRGDIAAAAQALDAARAAGPLDERMQLWALEIEGTAAAHAGAPRRARRAFATLVDRAAAARAPDAAWRARLGLARAWRAASSTTAIAQLRRAETELETIVRGVPSREGYTRFVARHADSARLLVELLVEAGDPVDAEAVAARALHRPLLRLLGAGRVARLGPTARAAWDREIGRYRGLRSELRTGLADRWQVPRGRAAVEAARLERVRTEMDEALARALALLPPVPELGPPTPRPGEALLTLSSLGGGRQALFIREAGAVRGWRGDAGGLPAVLDTVQARRWAIDAASPLPVPAGVEAVHVLRLGPTAPSAADRALVVGDPTGDLAGAGAEARSVARALRAQGLAVELLIGPAATLDAVLATLPRVGHFHYAGHARFAGRDGWRSDLPLADAPLRLQDLFTLPRAPATVVLSGCEAGRSADGAAHTLSLAHGFLIAGSRAVLAPTAPVSDTATEQLMTALYSAGLEAGLSAAIATVRDGGVPPLRALARRFVVVERR